jgi:tetratricopeptide (TPR) repeat protein
MQWEKRFATANTLKPPALVCPVSCASFRKQANLTMDTRALRSKANELLQSNDLQGAHALLAQLAQLLPDDSEIWCSLGWTSLHHGNIQAATNCYQKAVSLAPHSAAAHFGLAMALGHAGASTQAHHHLRQVIRLEPGHVEALVKLAYLEYLAGDITQALSYLGKARKLAPDHVELNVRYGIVYIAINDFPKAESCFRKALRHDPGNTEAISQLASMHAYAGDAEKAYRTLSPLLRMKPANSSAAMIFATFCRPLNRCDEAVELLQGLLTGPLSTETESRVHFALGKLYDHKGNYAKAFEQYELGNKLTDVSFDAWEQKQWVQSVRNELGPVFFETAGKARKLSNRIRPVFIVGMPRSGTTLVEQILSSHPAVYGAGERMEIQNIANTVCKDLGSSKTYPFCLADAGQKTLDTLARQYMEAVSKMAPGGAKIVTDKMPGNYQHLGLIQLLFPKARIIHCVRDPMDTCLSCYTNSLLGQAYSYNLTNLGRYYRLYEELMAHWKNALSLPVIDVHYEDMVDDPEGSSRSIVDFCGLEWSDQCLAFHKTKRTVLTASTDQVRQPIYRQSVARWKNYAEYLGELRTALEQRI